MDGVPMGQVSEALIAEEQVPDGELVALLIGEDGQLIDVIARRNGGDLVVWQNVCPHAGRRLDWAPGKFLRSKDGLLVCAVHGASFELQRGQCVAGPCRGEALREVAVHCADGDVRLGAAP